MRQFIAAIVLAVTACGTPETERTPVVSSAEYEVVALADTAVVMRAMPGGHTRIVHRDSMSKSIRPRDRVRPCWHTSNDERGHVTFCRRTGGGRVSTGTDQ